MATRTMPYRAHLESESEVEIIEDSEPEREARRGRERLERKRLQGRKASDESSKLEELLAPTQPDTPSQILQPASESFTSASTISSKSPSENIIAEGQITAPPPASSSAPVRRVAPPPWLASKENPAKATTLISPRRSFSCTQPSPVKQLDLNSFAFHRRASGARSVSYSTSSRSASSSKAPALNPSAESSKDTPPPSVKASSSSPKTFHLGATNGSSSSDPSFSHEQVASISSCVVCSNAWTVRKQPKSKWSHITTCARKHACGLETLHVKLIAAVVEAAEAKAQQKLAGEKEKEPPGPQSLLAHTLKESAAPRKRGRRKETPRSSLLPVEESQKSILKRGAALLGTDSLVQTGESQSTVDTIVTQRSQESEVENDAFDIPATQAFAPSRIAGRSKFFGSASGALSTDSGSGLLYADEPRAPVSDFGTSLGGSSSPLSAGSDRNSLVFISSSESVSPPLSIGSSIASLHPLDNLDSDSDDVRILDERPNSPARSDSSASVLILDSTLRDPPSPVYAASHTSSPSSPGVRDGPTSGGDNEQPDDGVFLWDDYVNDGVAQPPSPSNSLVDHLYALSIQESHGASAFGESRARSPSTQSISPGKRSKSPQKSPKPPKPRKRSKSPRRQSRSSSKRGSSDRAESRNKSQSLSPKSSRKGKSKGKGKAKSRSRSRSASPKPTRKRTTKKATTVLEDIQGDEGDLDARLLALITADETLYLRILRYEPIKLEDIVEMAVKTGMKKHGLPPKVKTFLDSQCINFYSEETMGRRKRR